MVLKCSGRMFGISLNNAIILIYFINACFFHSTDHLIFIWWLWNEHWFDQIQYWHFNLQHSLHKPANSLVGLPQEQVYPEHIPRNDKGRQVIRTVVQKACDLDRMVFSTAPTFNLATNECTVPGKTKLTLHEFVHQSPIYFQFAYFNVRNAEAYGKRVHSDLSRILKGLRKETPCRKEILQMVADLRSAKLAGKIDV